MTGCWSMLGTGGPLQNQPAGEIKVAQIQIHWGLRSAKYIEKKLIKVKERLRTAIAPQSCHRPNIARAQISRRRLETDNLVMGGSQQPGLGCNCGHFAPTRYHLAHIGIEIKNNKWHEAKSSWRCTWHESLEETLSENFQWKSYRSLDGWQSTAQMTEARPCCDRISRV